MNKFAIGCGVVIAIVLFVVVVAAISIAGTYNRLVRLQQTVDQSWAQVQNVYQRRADLIPNLVNTVSGAVYFWHASSCACGDGGAVRRTRMGANIPGSARLWRAGFGVPPKRSFIGQECSMDRCSRKKFAIAERNRQHATSVLSPIHLAAALLLMLSPLTAAEVIPPKPDRYFNDYAGVVPTAAAGRLNEQLTQFER